MKPTRYIITCIITVSICATLYLSSAQKCHEWEITLQNREGVILELTDTVEELYNQNTEYQTQIDELAEQLDTIQQQIDRKQDKTDRSGERLTSLGIYNVTGYCKCAKCCGKHALNRPDGKAYGADGTELIPGVSVAGWLPMGTRIMIDGQIYTVQDRTSGKIRERYGGKIIDIYCETHAEAWDVDNTRWEVWLVE